MEASRIFVVAHNPHKTMGDCAGCWQFDLFELQLLLGLVIFWLLKSKLLASRFQMSRQRTDPPHKDFQSC